MESPRVKAVLAKITVGPSWVFFALVVFLSNRRPMDGDSSTNGSRQGRNEYIAQTGDLFLARVILEMSEKRGGILPAPQEYRPQWMQELLTSSLAPEKTQYLDGRAIESFASVSFCHRARAQFGRARLMRPFFFSLSCAPAYARQFIRDNEPFHELLGEIQGFEMSRIGYMFGDPRCGEQRRLSSRCRAVPQFLRYVGYLLGFRESRIGCPLE